MSNKPGKAVVQRHDDGTVTVLHADDIIAVNADVLDAMVSDHLTEDGTLILDTAGEYRYREIGPEENDDRVIIYERVKPTLGDRPWPLTREV